MLSLHHRDDRLRRANNLLPTAEGGLETRPGAVQVIAGRVNACEAWGSRLIVEKIGRIKVWDGDEHDVCPAGAVLQATSFQALTSGAARESRAYIADGISTLWFIARRGGAYVRENVANTIVAGSGTPYPIPAASAIATWRGRLWINSGNRVQHCQFDRPAEWDPLWTVELQGGNPARVVALIDNRDSLGVGLTNATWEITGTSQYNWDKRQVSSFGVAGANALDGDGTRVAILAPQGIFMGDSPDPVSEDLRELFDVPIGIGELVLDTRRQLVLALVAGRLFAMHLAQRGLWGEITGTQATGLVRTDSHVGWYGEDGVWLLQGRDTADKRLDGTESIVTSVYDTWEQRPNLMGNGRALCERALLDVRGSTRGEATYTCRSPNASGGKTFARAFTLADEVIDTWSDDVSESAVWAAWPSAPVRREFVPRISGEVFRHTISAPCYMQIRRFEPGYRYGQEAA